MARAIHCIKCSENQWKVSWGDQKQLFLTCICGYNFNITPPTPMEILQKNKDSLREFLEKMVPFCPLTISCKKNCTGAWFACFTETMKSGVNPFGDTVEIPGATST